MCKRMIIVVPDPSNPGVSEVYRGVDRGYDGAEYLLLYRVDGEVGMLALDENDGLPVSEAYRYLRECEAGVVEVLGIYRESYVGESPYPNG